LEKKSYATLFPVSGGIKNMLVRALTGLYGQLFVFDWRKISEYSPSFSGIAELPIDLPLHKKLQEAIELYEPFALGILVGNLCISEGAQGRLDNCEFFSRIEDRDFLVK
jgi:hypothetical protein